MTWPTWTTRAARVVDRRDARQNTMACTEKGDNRYKTWQSFPMLEASKKRSPNDQNRTGDQLISEDTENGINHYSQSLYHLSYARIRHLPHTMQYKYTNTHKHTPPNNIQHTTNTTRQSPQPDDTYNTHSTHTKIHHTPMHLHERQHYAWIHD